MKRTLTVSFVVLLAGLLSGCFLALDDGVGTLGIELPDPQSSGTGDPTVARIYVINGSAAVPLGEGTDYVQETVDGQENEVSVGPIPSGSGYQVVLILGAIDEESDVFIPARYVVSEELAVYSGQATEVTLVPEDTPFVPVDPDDTLGENLIGLVFDGTALYTATPTAILVDAGVTDITTPDTGVDFGAPVAITSGEVANSMDLGALQGGAVVPFLNTDAGILPYSGVFEYTFDETSGITQTVLDSGGFTDASNELYAYFQYDGGLGGVWDDGTGQEWLSEIDLSSLVSGQPVYDLEVVFDGSNIYGYFATKLGAFRLSDALLRDDNIDTAQEVFNYSGPGRTIFFSAKIDDVFAPITEICIAGGGDAYIGTGRGVIITTVAEIEALDATPEEDVLEGDSSDPTSMIVESLGRYIEDIVAGGGYVAILTRQFVIVSNDNGVSFVAVPVAASSVGTPSAIFLDSLTGVLLVSGSTGLAGMDIDTVFP
jgi:hypothetical protein